MGDHSCRADSAKNRLYISVKGFFRERDGAEVYKDLESAVRQLESGFDVITDISGFVPCSSEAIDIVRKGAELVKQSGRRNAVRVTGGFVSGLMQFKRVLRPVFDEESVRYAKSIAEADAILDSLGINDVEPSA